MRELHSILLLLFLLPAVSLGQTVHIDKDKISYKGSIKFETPEKRDLRNEAKNILLSQVNASLDSLKEDKQSKELSTVNTTTLPSPYHLQKFLQYRVTVQPKGDEINYRIDDVRLILHERGEKKKIISSEHLLKGMEESGNSSIIAEKQLNEIDMHIQKTIALMKSSSH